MVRGRGRGRGRATCSGTRPLTTAWRSWTRSRAVISAHVTPLTPRLPYMAGLLVGKRAKPYVAGISTGHAGGIYPTCFLQGGAMQYEEQQQVREFLPGYARARDKRLRGARRSLAYSFLLCYFSLRKGGKRVNRRATVRAAAGYVAHPIYPTWFSTRCGQVC